MLMSQHQDTQPLDMFGVPINEDGIDSWEQEPQAPVNTGQPTGDGVQTQQQQDNDRVRYEYWQSQHDQLKNKYSQLETQYQTLAQQVQQQQAPVAPEPEEETFPEPPQAPTKPYGFSPQEAMSDPSSESARYLVQLAEHNQTMGQYNLIRSQWVEAKQREQFAKMSEAQRARETEDVRKAQTSTAVNQVIASVQQKYGVDYNTALDFVNTMSDDSSITIDNLFELYKMRKGGTPEMYNGKYVQPQPTNQQFNPFGVPIVQGQPSPEFQQRQRAQSIPPTMGVHNAQVAQPVDPMVAMFQRAIQQSNNQNVY